MSRWKALLTGAYFVTLSQSSLGSERYPARANWHIDEGATEPAESAQRSVLALSYNGVVVCTGTLIAPRVVLTARHCLGVQRATEGVDGNRPVSTRRVVDYESAGAGVDIALVLLDAPFDLPPLALRAAADSVPPERLRIIGYGHEDARYTGVRRYVDTRARGWGCSHGSRAVHRCSPGYDLVLSRKKGADTCAGDSGGPVLERTAKGWRVVAVTSRSVLSALVECGDGGVYVRIDAMRPWLDRAMAQLQTQKESSK